MVDCAPWVGMEYKTVVNRNLLSLMLYSCAHWVGVLGFLKWIKVEAIIRQHITFVIHQGVLRDGPFDIQGGAGIFLKKIVCFPTRAKK